MEDANDIVARLNRDPRNADMANAPPKEHIVRVLKDCAVYGLIAVATIIILGVLVVSALTQ